MNNELKNISILYVEDDDFIREHTAELLRHIFKEVFVAKDGKDGIYVYNEHSKEVDAILTDINMPNLSGIQMAQLIRKIQQKINKNSPIIALSAYSQEDYSFKELQENFAHYLKKPIKIKDLVINVNKALKGEVENYLK
jgi:CheY-like chemotaxis protein